MAWVAVGIAGGSALLGGIANATSGDNEEEKLAQYIKYLEESKAKYAQEFSKQKMDMMRMNEAQKKQTLTRANQKAAAAGMDPVASSYANEEGLDNSLNASMSQLDAQKEQVLRGIDEQIAKANLGSNPESGFSKFIGGALTGANIGMQASNMISKSGIDNKGDLGGDGKIKTDVPLKTMSDMPYKAPELDNLGMDILKKTEPIPQDIPKLQLGNEGVINPTGWNKDNGMLNGDNWGSMYKEGYGDAIPGQTDGMAGIKNLYGDEWQKKLKLFMRG